MTNKKTVLELNEKYKGLVINVRGFESLNDEDYGG